MNKIINNYQFTGDFMYSKITNAANNAWQELAAEKTMDQAGYVYIYTATESNTNVDIYFDDFDIRVEQTHIVAGNDYYPFGLPMVARSYEKQDYRYDYQSLSRFYIGRQYNEKDDETGYNAFQLRQYACPDAKQFGNARIGRWISPDPYGQFASAYVGMGNNPVTGVDPDGDAVINPILGYMASFGVGAVIGGASAKTSEGALYGGIGGLALYAGISNASSIGNALGEVGKSFKNLLGSQEWFPSTKSVLHEYYKNKHCQTCSEFSIHNRAGHAFEGAFHDWMKQGSPTYIDNGRRTVPLRFGDVEPDGLGTALVKPRGSKNVIPYPGAVWYEVKASINNVGIGKFQI